MRTIFLADAHLTEPCDHNYKLLLEFLTSLEGNTETLFIMGDLFDFWLGFPSQPFTQNIPLLEGLKALQQSGCRLVYFEGNHDFHLGDIFRRELGAEIHPGPAEFILQGQRLFLCHGDQINQQDSGYLMLRRLLHNRLVESAVSHFPPSLAMLIKNRLQHASRSGYAQKSKRWDYRTIIREFAAGLSRAGYQGLVTGHFHLDYCEQLTNGFTVLSLGDWMERFTYGEMKDGRLMLRRFCN